MGRGGGGRRTDDVSVIEGGEGGLAFRLGRRFHAEGGFSGDSR